ncbi:hypothetical protein GQ43DRAFT_267039 [Delitschia confertaspora ATCC 74209]|uniref:Uncharacterized protein n=1 Tax=Delitschia confertaspora ATCC 74209 TaxID=1513339 RepID=A0A9P4JGU4_9PLEO|nr:hypothetical protein GQ43DRAFT_267039 [Delitschia confertaspora ATCC 74209]
MSRLFFVDSEDPQGPLPAPTTAPLFTEDARAPEDNFRVRTSDPPNTIHSLTLKTPHTDKFDYYRPTAKSSQLLPAIEEVVSNSPAAIVKYESLLLDKDQDLEIIIMMIQFNVLPSSQSGS